MKSRERIIVILASAIMITSALSFAEKEESAEVTFQKAMQYAGSLKNTIKTDGDNIYAGTLKFEPGKAFTDPKSQKSWYTNNPEPVRYYSDTTSGNIYEMQKEATAETVKNENRKDLRGNPIPTPAKTVAKSFRSRAVFKVTSSDEYISKGNIIIQNARNIVTGESNKEIACQENKDKVICTTTFEEKTCTEEVRVCEKIPKIKIKEEIYPGCQVRMSPTGKEECLIGTYSPGGPDYGRCNGCPQTCNTYHVNLPKHLHARVEVAGSNHKYFHITVVNETTGQILHSHSPLNNGDAFELTHSHAQDQVFKFVVCRADGCNCDSPGYLTLYIDRKYRSADIDWEESCNDL